VRYVDAGGLRVSAIGLGTWQFGSKEWGYGERYAATEARAIVERAVELGVTLFDTAEIYGSGRSERILGEAVRAVSTPVVVATKYAPLLPLPGRAAAHLRASRERLEREVIDLYQVHFPNPIVPMQPLFAELEAEVFAGSARALGVSNFSLDAWRTAEDGLRIPIVSNQVHLSLARRRSLRELVPWAQAHDRLIIAFSPLEQGLLGGRYGSTRRPRDFRRFRRAFRPPSLLAAQPVLEELSRMAARHDATVAQVALAWVISRPNVAAIPGASSVRQLEENVAAVRLELTLEELVRLEALAERAWPGA